jgi:hypothetical protein
MRAVADYLEENRQGLIFVLTETEENLIVEVPKSEVDSVTGQLLGRFENVAPFRLAQAMLPYLHQFILVKPMITEAPVVSVEGILIPTLEKILVDLISDKENQKESNQRKLRFLQMIETYPVHIPRLMRYAARKGKKEEVEKLLGELNQKRVSIVRTLQECLSGAPVSKAWVFGSFARMEERDDSDIDILVSLDNSQPMGLMSFSELILKMEKATGKSIDLVVDRSVKPFARESIQRDKVLIYERAS